MKYCTDCKWFMLNPEYEPGSGKEIEYALCGKGVAFISKTVPVKRNYCSTNRTDYGFFTDIITGRCGVKARNFEPKVGGDE